MRRADAMTGTTGFSDVDASARADELIDYLTLLADRLAAMRRTDFDRLQIGSGAAVLDVGCGAGEVCVALARRVGPTDRVCGVDLSAAMVEAARTAAHAAGMAVEHRVAGIHELPYPDASFDVVRAERVFQHIDDPARALAEMIRVARPGGRVMVIDPDHSQWALSAESPLATRVTEVVRGQLLRAIVNPRVGTRLRGLFRAAGLADVDAVARVLDVAWADLGTMMFLPMHLQSAAAAGEISAEEAARFCAEMEALDTAGRFTASAVGYSVMGTKH